MNSQPEPQHMGIFALKTMMKTKSIIKDSM
ncbi:hypothetical protein Y788_04765 [Pantoea dispersa 625]|nr:hypothetical protein Y788_04765 [Pantoea dispersa 625]